MSEIYSLFKHLINCLENTANESIKLSLNDVHSNNIFSLVVDGIEFGKLTRIFIAGKKLKPFEVQYHTHRYPIKLTVIKGNITHHTAFETSPSEFNCTKISKYDYKSFLTGGKGLKYLGDTHISCIDYKMAPGTQIKLNTIDFHTMSVSKGSIWVVEELGFEKESSQVLGVPFITDGLYNKPEMFQVNDKCQVVLKELRGIIKNYESIL
jgi:hypothetical protein